MRGSLLGFVALTSVTLTQAADSICDKYSKQFLGASNASTQYTLLTLLVNTAIIGNYSNSSHSLVPGILTSNATYKNATVNLLPYFDGSLASTNRGGKTGVGVNFLDDGGADALKQNKPSLGIESKQYKLLMHLYAFFGVLLGCSDIGSPILPTYTGETSMYEVHKFMALNNSEVGYFIEQVGLSAKSFGVSEKDYTAVGKGLQKVFGKRCAPPENVLGKEGEQKKRNLQAICIAKDCPPAASPTCNAYDDVMMPKAATATATATATPSSMNGTDSGGEKKSGSTRTTASLLALCVFIGSSIIFLA